MTSAPEDAVRVRPYDSGDEEAVVALWGECGLLVPHNDPRRDIALKLAFQPELFFVAEAEDGNGRTRVVATCMAGYEGHRGWLNYLAVDPALRGRGIGRAVVAHAEAALRALGCPKINLLVRRSNEQVVGFYERLGFEVADLVFLGKPLRGQGERK
ncbi:GCN5-related N-acetyltransferase [Desulfovibrio sp. X2]|uniref:GNAT family acetyltransferase n=1 Tax=Desulfovibrio sp. X2 TaxID=941449 RepID=UPI0003588DBE|nr:GNAT family acetyltransferase [Desulfovibrio sp. X2]EPR44560.1 GCN5-related N-acetyltransferase [Desulfovibrio sp. X2]